MVHVLKFYCTYEQRFFSRQRSQFWISWTWTPNVLVMKRSLGCLATRKLTTPAPSQSGSDLGPKFGPFSTNPTPPPRPRYPPTTFTTEM